MQRLPLDECDGDTMKIVFNRTFLFAYNDNGSDLNITPKRARYDILFLKN